MRHWLGFILAAAAASCSAQYPGSPTPTPTLAAIQLHYQGVHERVSPGGSVGLTLWAISSEGAYESVNSRATWFSSNTSVATVTNGSARAVALGTADVVASYQGLTATAPIIVQGVGRQYPFLDISFSVPEPGRTTRATVRYSQTPASSSRDVTAEATWTSSDPNVFTVEAGQVTGRGPGTAMLTATYGGGQASAYGSVPPMRVLP
jgi:hypothetical protein